MVHMALARGVLEIMLGFKVTLFALVALLFAMEPIAPTIKVTRERFIEEFAEGIMSLSPEDLQTRDIILAMADQQLSLLEYLKFDLITAVCKDVFDPQNGMFDLVGKDKHLLHIRSMNEAPGESLLSRFHFVGRFLGLTIKYRWELPVAFSRLFFKSIIPAESVVTSDDIGEFDEEQQRCIQTCLEFDDVESLFLDFTFCPGRNIQVELVPGGADIPVTNENVGEFVGLYLETFRSWGRQEQAQRILWGITEVLGEEFCSGLDWHTLSLRIDSCLPSFNLDEWIANFSYINCDANTPEVQYLVQYLQDLPVVCQMLAFEKLTGIVRLPVSGMKDVIHLSADLPWQYLIMYDSTQLEIDIDQAHNILILPAVSQFTMELFLDAILDLEEDV